MSNFRPQSCIEFNNSGNEKKYLKIRDGICDPCTFSREKKQIDWEHRKQQLIDLLAEIRDRNLDRQYEMIIPSSGGKDSTYQVYLLKKIHQARVLTVTWAPHIYSGPGFNNFQNMIHNLGVDNLLFTPNGRVHRLLTRLAFQKLFHPFQPFIIGQKNIGVRYAIQQGIETIFYGENEAEYGNDVEGNQVPFRDPKYCIVDDDECFDDYYISGVKVKELISDYGLSYHDLVPYLPIKRSELGNLDIKIYYLGYFYPWDPQQVYYRTVRECGFRPNDHRTQGSYCKYSSFDDRTDGFHYWTTWIKFGLGRCTYDTAQEIRNGKITLEEGRKLVEKYDGELPTKFLAEFLNYIDMDVDQFFEIVDQYRNPRLWEKIGDHLWKLKHTCYGQPKIDDSYFKAKEALKQQQNRNCLIKYTPLTEYQS